MSAQILALDDEALSLHGLSAAIQEAEPNCTLFPFSRSTDAVAFAREHPVDIAFLDIALGATSGITVARQLKQLRPAVNIIFVTGYSEYTGEAMDMHASGYIMKPVTAEKVRRELADLRYPLEEPKEKPRVRIKTFGEFQIFVDDEPVAFRYMRTKELLALLTDRRGAFCSNGMIISTLWEECMSPQKDSYLRMLRQDLRRTLEKHGVKDIILQHRGEMALQIKNVQCDYYDWIEHPDEANLYTGEYMCQYSWAEPTNALIAAATAAKSY
ncbi:MAG: response regulator [Treponema sp.]|nr:response regulator [Treponema sp.]